MNHRVELENEIKILKEKTTSLINQFEICCSLMLDRLSDINHLQEYILNKIKGEE